MKLYDDLIWRGIIKDISSPDLEEKLNSLSLPGVYFRRHYFTPTFSKYKDELCGGVFVHITDRDKFDTIKTSWTMLHHIRTTYSEHFKINKPYVEGRPTLFHFEAGSEDVIVPNQTLEEQLKHLEENQKEFKEIRKPYLLY